MSIVGALRTMRADARPRIVMGSFERTDRFQWTVDSESAA
jgi:hypothetical protein